MITLRDAGLVFLGGGLGAVARFLAAAALPKVQTQGFPVAILLVNLIGCFVLGLIVGAAARAQGLPRTWTTFLGVGVCGGFTTFSTFGIDALELFEEGRWLALSSYVLGSVVGGIVAAALGVVVAR